MDEEQVQYGWIWFDAQEVKSAWLTVDLKAGDRKIAVTMKMLVLYVLEVRHLKFYNFKLYIYGTGPLMSFMLRPPYEQYFISYINISIHA